MGKWTSDSVVHAALSDRKEASCDDVETLLVENRQWAATPRRLGTLKCDNYDGKNLTDAITARIYWIEDVASLGHMQMSFVQLFQFLQQIHANGVVREGDTVYACFLRKGGDLEPVRATYYVPMLADILAFAKKQWNLTVQEMDSEVCLPPLFKGDPSTFNFQDIELLNESSSVPCHEFLPPSTQRVSVHVRQCTTKQYIGHCGAWFHDAAAVENWRRFLSVQVGIPCDVSRNSSILVFDRAKGYKRSLIHPLEVVDAVRGACPHCNTTYFQFQGLREEAGTANSFPRLIF